MTTPDAAMGLASGRVAILAGSGRLPEILADDLADRDDRPFVIALAPDTGNWSEKYDHARISLTRLSDIIACLRRAGAVRVVLAGGISSRPRLSSFKLDMVTLRLLWRLASALRKGDDGLLRAAVTWLESQGFAVVGAHQLVPDLLATEGNLTRVVPSSDDLEDLAAARQETLRLGAADIGQAAVARDGRIIASEGRAGTKAMLEQIAQGATGTRKSGVLAKFSKPGQEMRVDLPSIGPDTVEQAAKAGLAGIVVEAGRSLILDRDMVVAKANALGIFVAAVRV